MSHLLSLRMAKRACELAPDDPRCWCDLGRVHASLGELDQAIQCFVESVEIDVRYADGWHNLGVALAKKSDNAGAFTALKNALLIDGTRASTCLVLGNLLVNTGQLDDAVECFERAAFHDPTLAHARSRLAQQLSQRGKVKRAEQLFRQSVGLKPDHLPGWLGLARTLEDIGESKGALGCYLNVITQHPQHPQAIGQYLALIPAEDKAEVQVSAAMTILNDSAATEEAKAVVGYGLLKYHDRRGQYAEAAAAGLAANAARRQENGPLNREILSARIDQIIQAYNKDFFLQRQRFGLGTDQPVFIVGLPRSGTTLTEQILSAHPLLHGAGELPDLARIAANYVADNEMPWQVASKLEEMQSRELAQIYLDTLRGGAVKNRLRISDKAPLNFFHLAFIALLFPQARIIHCQRQVRDNALSIWMENFNADQHYATDFDDLAFFIVQYQRLMNHWREHLPLKILEMRYEDTVADLERQARRLMSFLNVPWDDSCLQFHQNKRAVQTPSRWQVREPVHARSMERWKHYAPYLPTLQSAFL